VLPIRKCVKRETAKINNQEDIIMTYTFCGSHAADGIGETFYAIADTPEQARENLSRLYGKDYQINGSPEAAEETSAADRVSADVYGVRGCWH
jgi:hypothetical protein